MANVAIHLRLGYFVADEKVMRADLASRRYRSSIQGWLDVLACLPLDIFQAASGWHPAWRLNKLLRVWSLSVHLKTLQRSTAKPQLINSIILLRLLATWLILPHLAACCRILIARENNGDTWEPTESVQAKSIEMQYLHALYWCMGLMTGYADGTVPSTIRQYVFTLALINLGLFTFAYTVGVLSSMGDAGRDRANDFVVMVNATQRFLRRHELPAELEVRVVDFLLHRWRQICNDHKELIDAAALLEQLPPCVRFEAVLSLTQDALTKVPLFARVESGFMNALTQKMQPVNASIGELLIQQGAFSDAMYIVLRGRLNVTVDGKKVSVLSSGSFFGEQSLLAQKAADSQIETASL